MANFFNTAKKLLKDYDYLHYKQIVDLALSKGGFHTDGKTPELTMSSRLGSDIRNKGIKSTFIRIGDGIFALRKLLKEDNLLTYLKYRLKNLPFWQIDDKDKKYLLEIFGRDIFEGEKIELFNLLEKLKNSGKIIDYKKDGDNILPVFRKEENEVSEDLKEKIEIFTKDTEKFKELGENFKINSGIKELNIQSSKILEDLKNIIPIVSANGLLEANKQSIEAIKKIELSLKGIYQNNITNDFSQIFSGLTDTLKLYDTSKFNKIKLDEFNNLQKQLGVINQMFKTPEALFETILKNGGNNYTEELTEVINLKDDIKGSFTHTFEGYLQEGDFTTIRGYAKIQDLANISEAIYFDNGGIQRNEDKARCEKIKKYIESGNKRFFPEVVLGLYVKDNGFIKLENSTKGDSRKVLSGLSNYIKTIKIDLSNIKKGDITRIDGNHRLFYTNNLKQDFFVPFCFVIFNQKGENKNLVETHKNQEANIFYLLNGKNQPVTSEEALQVLLNMEDEEANSLYQNDSTLGLTKVCKQKYENYLNTNSEDTKRNFGDKIYTKFELLIKYIEKIGIKSNEIMGLIDKIFSSIQHLDEEYNKIIIRDDFLFLVLNVVLDNKEKTPSKINKIIKEFFDWILKEGLEEISSSEKPILWELKKKDKSFKETINIHAYQIDENKYNGDIKESTYKDLISLINESRKKIIQTEIEEKRIGLEKIVDAYSKILDILGNGGTDNAGRVDKIIKRFFHSSNKENMKNYLKDDFYDNLGKRVMNNDFAIRHHEIDKESLEDKEFIEFLYSEYDNAIKFILYKAGFLIK